MKTVDKAYKEIQRDVKRQELVPFGEYDIWSDNRRLDNYLIELGYSVVQDKNKTISQEEFRGLLKKLRGNNSVK